MCINLSSSAKSSVFNKMIYYSIINSEADNNIMNTSN